MSSPEPPVICLDGPSGAGKGTVSRILAARLGWHLLDSGALYRLTALAEERRETPLRDEQAVADVAAHLDPRFVADANGDMTIFLDGEEVTGAIRRESVSSGASRVAAMAAVREALIGRQRGFRREPGLVADGRDMGTVVFPEAPLKIFLTASAEERARRRHKQLMDMGFDANLSQLIADIAERDRRDAEREVSPLHPAADAVTLDTTEMSVAEVVAEILELSRERGLATGGEDAR